MTLPRDGQKGVRLQGPITPFRLSSNSSDEQQMKKCSWLLDCKLLILKKHLKSEMTNKTEPLHKGQKESGPYIKVQTRVNAGIVRQKRERSREVVVMERWPVSGGSTVQLNNIYYTTT